MATVVLLSIVCSFVFFCGQGSSLLWTPVLRPYSYIAVQCACPWRGRELVGVCNVC